MTRRRLSDRRARRHHLLSALAALLCAALASAPLGACGGSAKAEVAAPAAPASTDKGKRKAPSEPAAREPAAAGDVQRGKAAWYGGELHGSPTASGEPFDKEKLTAAHRTLPLGSVVRVTNVDNGKTVTVRINDRGPYGKRRRIIDVSEAAARALDFIDAGLCSVSVEVLSVPEKKGKARK